MSLLQNIEQVERHEPAKLGFDCCDAPAVPCSLASLAVFLAHDAAPSTPFEIQERREDPGNETSRVGSACMPLRFISGISQSMAR